MLHPSWVLQLESPPALQGGQANACSKGRKEPYSISESVASTNTRWGPRAQPGCPSPAVGVISQFSCCPREESTLFSILRAFCQEESRARAASLLPGGKGKTSECVCCSQCPRDSLLTVSARDTSCHKCGAGWRGV